LGGIIRPTQVTAKFNPKCHILVIKAKQNVTNKAPLRRADETLEQEDTLSQQSGYKTALGNIVRVVPLPENIHLHLLKVQMTPNIHQIIVKAPFVLPGEELKQQQIRYSSKWVPINVTVKDSSMDVLSYHQPLGTTRTPYELDRTAAYQKGYPQEEQRAKYYIPGKQWQTISSNVEGQERYLIKQEEEQEDLQKTSISRLLRPEYIRDPVTGKLAMMIKVNTVGFLPEEVVVRVDQTQRILTVEAAKRQEDQPLGDRKEVSRKQQQVLEQGIPLKYFRREFVLPQWLDVTHIGYRVLQNGLLAIKLPIVKLSKANKSSKEFDEVDVEEHQVKNVDWETPLSA
jgi:HSP20 family molecular chaperone IbpA